LSTLDHIQDPILREIVEPQGAGYPETFDFESDLLDTWATLGSVGVARLQLVKQDDPPAYKLLGGRGKLLETGSVRPAQPAYIADVNLGGRDIEGLTGLVVVLGATGSGKSTLLRHLVQVLVEDGAIGRSYVFGETVGSIQGTYLHTPYGLVATIAEALTGGLGQYLVVDSLRPFVYMADPMGTTGEGGIGNRLKTQLTSIHNAALHAGVLMLATLNPFVRESDDRFAALQLDLESSVSVITVRNSSLNDMQAPRHLRAAVRRLDGSREIIEVSDYRHQPPAVAPVPASPTLVVPAGPPTAPIGLGVNP
jgi:energy-coupling factor transporter ATP-binding protein EcfA2